MKVKLLASANDNTKKLSTISQKSAIYTILSLAYRNSIQFSPQDIT